MKEIEDEIEDAKEPDFEDIIEQKIENIKENPDENLKKLIFKDINEKYVTEALKNKTLEFYKSLKLNENIKGFDIIKSIFKKVLKCYKFNISSRLIDFFDYILSISGLKLEYLKKVLEIETKNLPEDNKKDIIFFWKKCIAEDQLKEGGINISSNQMKNSLTLLLKHNFNINEISYIFLLFKKVIINTDDNTTQSDILNCLISILIIYPKFLKETNEEKREELKDFLDKYIIKVARSDDPNSSKYIFDEKKNVALDFYLKISGDKNYNKSTELNVTEIYQYLKINNREISEELINKIDINLKIIHSVIDNVIYKNYDKSKFQSWAKNELKSLKLYNPDVCTGKILGMISLALKKNRGYYLRNTQLIATIILN